MTRTHVRRRRFSLLIGAGMLVAVMTGPVAHAFSGPTDRPARSYVVRPGDSLWSIAQREAPGSDPRVVVDGIRSASGLAGGSIIPGQRLTVPTGS